MSIFRTAAVGTLIVGAGLGSLVGVASAHESDHAAKGCSNGIEGASKNGAGRTAGDTTGGAQRFDASNVCDILNGNKVLSDNNSAATGNVVNGDTRTENSQSTSSSSISSTVTGLLP